MDEAPFDAIRFLGGLQPDPDALLALLRCRVDDSILHQIAEADYGKDERAHFEALLRIRDSGELPSSGQWHPIEVLSLHQHGEPAESDLRGHLSRAFCVAVLLRVGTVESTWGDERAALEKLSISALALGPEMVDATVRFLAWRVAQCREFDEEGPQFGLALLLLAATRPAPPAVERALIRLAEWITIEESRVRHMMGVWGSVPWLTGLILLESDQNKWRDLVRRLYVRVEPTLAGELRCAIDEIALRVLRGNP